MINARERVLLLVKLQPEACNPAKSNTPLWGFFSRFLIVQMLVKSRKGSHINLTISDQ